MTSVENDELTCTSQRNRELMWEHEKSIRFAEMLGHFNYPVQVVVFQSVPTYPPVDRA